tara:strand:- start:544 stop:2697 length:2154 start_codon:yes stop_codon:yes gene_type:complete
MAIEKEYTLKVSTETAQKNVDELNKSLSAQEELINEIENELLQYEKQLKKTSKSDLAGRKKLNDQIAKTKDRLAEEKNGLKNVNKERKNANKELKESTANAADYSGVLGIIDKKTGGAISGFTNLTKTVGGATKGFNLMKIAIIGTGIGALLILLTSLTAAFTSSEEGQNKFAKMMGVIGAVVSVFTDRLASLGELIISVFENPKQALIDFKDAFVKNITNRISSAIETIGFLGSAIKKVFSGDFGGAMDDAKKAGSSYVDTLTGVKDTIGKVTEATKELSSEIIKEGNAAAKIADQRAEANKLERKLGIERAEANRKRADLLDKAANKELYTAQQRIDFLKEAGKIDEEITNKEVKLAELRLKAKIAENNLGKSTTEDLNEEAQLRAKLIDLETAKLTKAKTVTAQIVGAQREAAADKKALDDQEIADAKAVQDFKDSLIETDKGNKLAAIEKEKEDRILALESLKLSEEEKQQMILDVEASFKEKKKLIEEEEKVIKDEKLAAFLEKEIEQKQLTLDEEKAESLAKLERLGGNLEQRAAIEKKYADIQKKNEEEIRKTKIIAVGSTFSKIAGILGENSKAGKAAAAAAALINTYQGITAELATKTVTPFGFAMKLVNIASTAAIGFKSVKSILSTNTSTGGGGAATNPAAGAQTMTTEPVPPTPPAFNVVGASETNQLADAISGQTQQPVQAFVVSSDVSTSQELDRNIITGASL